MDKLFAIAKVAHASGTRGEVRVQPLSRYFDDYISEKPLFLGESKGVCRKTRLIKTVIGSKKSRFQFEGIDSRDEAEAVIGQYLFASVSLEDDINLISSDLIGFTVLTEEGDVIGVLIEILWLPVQDIYVIQNDKREYLIPVIPEIIRRINHDGGFIEISPMDGLLD